MNERKTITPLGLLTGVRELLTDPKNWIQNCEAKTPLGARRLAEDKETTCFCIQGAAIRTANPSGTYDSRLRGEALRILSREFRAALPSWTGPAWEFNDTVGRTHAEILAVLDSRIEFHLKEQQK